MAVNDLTNVPASIAMVHPENAILYTLIAAAAINAGQPLYINTNGKADLADANATTPANRFRGIALNSVAAGGVVTVLIQGFINGVGAGITALAYDADVFVSDTAGTLADAKSAAGTELVVGKVLPLSDGSLTKCLYVTGFSG